MSRSTSIVAEPRVKVLSTWSILRKARSFIMGCSSGQAAAVARGDASDRRDEAVEQEAGDADVGERDDDVGEREEFHASQMKKPMPTPPVSISAATT